MRTSRKAFSLVEMIVVIAVIGIMISMSVAGYRAVFVQSQDSLGRDLLAAAQVELRHEASQSSYQYVTNSLGCTPGDLLAGAPVSQAAASPATSSLPSDMFIAVTFPAGKSACGQVGASSSDQVSTDVAIATMPSDSHCEVLVDRTTVTGEALATVTAGWDGASPTTGCKVDPMCLSALLALDDAATAANPAVGRYEGVRMDDATQCANALASYV